MKLAYQKIPPKLAQKLNAKGPAIAPAGGRNSYGRPKSPFRVPQIAQHPHGSHGARASAIPSSKVGSSVNYGSYGGSSYAAVNKNYGNYRYNQVSSSRQSAAEYSAGQGNQVQSYENVDYPVYVDDDYYQE